MNRRQSEPEPGDVPGATPLTREELSANWALLLSWRDRAVAALQRRYGLSAEAEDLVHEAMLRLVRLPNLDPKHVGGLLALASDRLAIDQHRRRLREYSASARLGLPPDPAPDELAVDRVEALRLAGQLPALSRLERTAVLGKAQGLEPRQTAELLGVSPKSVHLALARARAALKAAGRVGGIIIFGRFRRKGAPARRVLQGLAIGASCSVVSLFLMAPSPSSPNSHADLEAQRATQPTATHSHSASSATSASGHAGAAGAAHHGPLSTLAANRGGPTVIAQVGVPDPRLGHGTLVTVTRSHGNQSLLQSLQACLQPGAISLDPRHAGCGN